MSHILLAALSKEMSSLLDFRQNDLFQELMVPIDQVSQENQELYCHNCCELVRLRPNQFACRYCYGYQLERVADTSTLERQSQTYT